MENEENKKIAELLFPDIHETLEDLEAAYPPRNLPEGATVTRFAPSPTGFLHIGTIANALIAERVAHTSQGIFILRIEDTDKKREIKGGIDEIIHNIESFNISPDEGVMSEEVQKGAYGPYLQSQRLKIYAIAAKYLVSQGLAYPCFCTDEDLKEIRNVQISQKVKPGYYGQFAKHRDISLIQIQQEFSQGKPFAIRIKSDAKVNEKIQFKDMVKGSLTMAANDVDFVLLKSDGYATYHFAHPIDDHFMHITHILRADEWLPSTPLHLQIFRYFGWNAPYYAHVSPVLKMDGLSKRKLSKRKDPEAGVKYYTQEGYSSESVITYLLNLANSNFEDWRRTHPDLPYSDFPFRIEKINNSGALFDLRKMQDISKQVMAQMSSQQMYDMYLTWAEKYDPEFAELIKKQKEYTLQIFSIEKDQQARRKDIYAWNQMHEYIGCFYDELFEKLPFNKQLFPEFLSGEEIKDIINAYLQVIDLKKPSDQWFNDLKAIAAKFNIAPDTKTFKESPAGTYKGYVGDIASILRVAITKRKNTPDLYEIMKVMGIERVVKRLQETKDLL